MLGEKIDDMLSGIIRSLFKRDLAAGLSLKANFSWTFVGNVVYSGSQWLMLSALTKIGSPEMVGQFVLGLAVTTPVIMFSNLQLRNIQATDQKREYRFGDYLGLRLTTSTLALTLIIGIVLLSDYSRTTSLVIVAVGVSKVVETFCDVYYGLMQQYERMDKVAQSFMIRGPLSFVALATAVYVTNDVFWGVVGLIVVWTLVLVLRDIPNGRRILASHVENNEEFEVSPHWQPSILWQLAWLALPLGLVHLLVSLNTNIPRYFIEGFLGESALGIFAAVAYLKTAGMAVIVALGQSASPRLATYYVEGNRRKFTKLLLRLLGIGVLTGGGGVAVALIAGRLLLSLIYQPEYAQPDLFAWIMLAAGMTYLVTFLGYGLTAARLFKIQTVLIAISTTITALCCWLLIPQYGLIGAAFSLLIPAVVHVLISLVAVWSAVRRLTAAEMKTTRA